MLFFGLLWFFCSGIVSVLFCLFAFFWGGRGVETRAAQCNVKRIAYESDTVDVSLCLH